MLPVLLPLLVEGAGVLLVVLPVFLPLLVEGEGLLLVVFPLLLEAPPDLAPPFDLDLEAPPDLAPPPDLDLDAPPFLPPLLFSTDASTSPMVSVESTINAKICFFILDTP